MRARGREAQPRGEYSLHLTAGKTSPPPAPPPILKKGSGLLCTSEKRMGGRFHCSQDERNQLQLAGEKPTNNN